MSWALTLCRVVVVACCRHVQERFYADFPPHKNEAQYKYETGSSMKPTLIATPPGSTNQIPGQCTITGDIRLTPFYSVDDVKAKIEKYVAELDVTALATRGWSKYELKNEGLKGTVTLKWLGAAYKGVACDLKSTGYQVCCVAHIPITNHLPLTRHDVLLCGGLQALHEAIGSVRGSVTPFSLTGSLPCIRDLQDAGFDVQVTGTPPFLPTALSMNTTLIFFLLFFVRVRLRSHEHLPLPWFVLRSLFIAPLLSHV